MAAFFFPFTIPKRVKYMKIWNRSIFPYRVRQIRNSEYVIASRCMGGGFFHILWHHLAPNFISSIMFMVDQKQSNL